MNNLQKIEFKRSGKYLVGVITAKDLGFKPTYLWLPSPSITHKTDPYKLPKTIKLDIRQTHENGCKFSPVPSGLFVGDRNNKVIIMVQADKDWHNWSIVEFKASSNSVRVSIDLEGHSNASDALKHTKLYIKHAERQDDNWPVLTGMLKELYPYAYKQTKKKVPDWWLRPMYCGWGDQVGINLDLEGLGLMIRAMAYCTQGLYERWIDRLDEAGVPIGTVAIDAGWSLGGRWEPNRLQWPDMRGFIDRQHKKGRKVLLWIGTFLNEGLPDEWCTKCGDTTLVADPSNPAYRRYIREAVGKLLSSGKGCYNADGFKIDQLQYTPSENMPMGGDHFDRHFFIKGKHPKTKTHGKKWGMELLYTLQKEIYDAAKNAKKDALVTSSTVHPYFHDTYDMTRLHDGNYPWLNIKKGMEARAMLSKATFPDKLIDPDNWVESYYDKWLEYTINSPKLGIGSIMFSEYYVLNRKKLPTHQIIPMKDLKKIGRAWNEVLG